MKNSKNDLLLFTGVHIVMANNVSKGSILFLCMKISFSIF